MRNITQANPNSIPRRLVQAMRKNKFITGIVVFTLVLAGIGLGLDYWSERQREKEKAPIQAAIRLCEMDKRTAAMAGNPYAQYAWGKLIVDGSGMNVFGSSVTADFMAQKHNQDPTLLNEAGWMLLQAAEAAEKIGNRRFSHEVRSELLGWRMFAQHCNAAILRDPEFSRRLKAL